MKNSFHDVQNPSSYQPSHRIALCMHDIRASLAKLEPSHRADALREILRRVQLWCAHDWHLINGATIEIPIPVETKDVKREIKLQTDT